MVEKRVVFFKKEYRLPGEIGPYVKMLHFFDTIYSNAMLPLSRFLNSKLTEFSEINWRSEFSKIVEIVVDGLVDLGVYDVTAFDLLDDNAGLLHLESITKDYNDQGRQILKTAYDSFMQRWDQTRLNTSAMVTGTGTSIWTNSVTSLLVFSAIESSTVKGQIAQADIAYKQAMNRITQQNEDWLQTQIKLLNLNMYIPQCMEAINQFCSEVCEVYISALDRAGLFTRSAIDQYDLQRSNHILDNFDKAKSKIELLQKAFEYCPYNEKVFLAAIKNGMIDNSFLDTASAIGFSFPETDIIDACKKAKNSNIDIRSLLDAVANTYHKKQNEVAQEVFCEEINEIQRFVETTIGLLEDSNRFEDWVERDISNTAEQLCEMGKKEILYIVSEYVNRVFPHEAYKVLDKNDLDLLPLFREIKLSNNTKIDAVDKLIQSVSNELSDKVFIYQSKTKEFIDNKRTAYNDLTIQIKVLQREHEEFQKKIHNELELLQTKYKKLGLLSFSEKKKIRNRIGELNRELENDPIELKVQEATKRIKAVKTEMNSFPRVRHKVQNKSVRKESGGTELKVQKYY